MNQTKACGRKACFDLFKPQQSQRKVSFYLLKQNQSQRKASIKKRQSPRLRLFSSLFATKQ